MTMDSVLKKLNMILNTFITIDSFVEGIKHYAKHFLGGKLLKNGCICG